MDKGKAVLLVGGLFGLSLLISKSYNYYLNNMVVKTNEVTDSTDTDKENTVVNNTDKSIQTDGKIQNGQFFSK